MDDIYEAVLIDHTVDEINPLVSNPGRLLLSTKQIYFQPYNNVQPVNWENLNWITSFSTNHRRNSHSQYPVIKINLEAVSSLIKRRFLLRQIVSDTLTIRVFFFYFRSPMSMPSNRRAWKSSGWKMEKSICCTYHFEIKANAMSSSIGSWNRNE